MRVITGIYKGRKLAYPKSRSVRPTMDRVKESMFNMLGASIAGEEVLSIFSGSGSLGIEALSRGARHVVFVDSYRESIDAINSNITALGIDNTQVEVLQYDAIKSIELFYNQKRAFTYIFIDPPYYKNYIKKTLMKLEAFDILSPTSYLVIEHAKEEPVPESDSFTVNKQKRFGSTYVTICKRMAYA